MSTAKRYHPLRLILPGAIYLLLSAVFLTISDIQDAITFLILILPVMGGCCCLSYGMLPLRWTWLAPVCCTAFGLVVGVIVAPSYPWISFRGFWVILLSPYFLPIASYLLGRAYLWAVKQPD